MLVTRVAAVCRWSVLTRAVSTPSKSWAFGEEDEERKFRNLGFIRKQDFLDAFRFAEARSQVFQGPMLPSDSPKEWLEREAEAFENGRIRLAHIMGVNPEEFSRRQMKEALEYLLPSSLHAKDARPRMEHPSAYFRSGFDADCLDAVKLDGLGFYTRAIAYHDFLYEIFCQAQIVREESQKPDMQEKAAALAANGENEIVKSVWSTKSMLEQRLGAKLSDRQYNDIVAKLEKLSQHKFSFVIADFLNKHRTVKTADFHAYRRSFFKVQHGQAVSVGRRKNAVATVWLNKGTGQFCINKGRTLLDYFPNQVERQQLLYPFLVTNTVSQFDVKSHVHGGGPTGQAGAMRLAISKALIGFNKEFYPLLHSYGLLIRDPRMVERKKTSKTKARKEFNWKK